MTDDKPTVAVPLDDLRTIEAVLKAYGSDEALELIRTHIPQTRYVIVDRDKMFPGQNLRELIDNSPALFPLLDEVLAIPAFFDSSRLYQERLRAALDQIDG